MKAHGILVQMDKANLGAFGFDDLIQRFLVQPEIHENEVQTNLRHDLTGEKAVQ